MSWSDFIATQTLADSAEAPYLSHCDHLAVVRVHGEEAGHYLQGQVSCDLREVDQQGHRTGMHLSLKGRGLVSVRIVRDGDDYLLLCPAVPFRHKKHKIHLDGISSPRLEGYGCST